MNQSFGKQHRLLKADEFQAALKDGCKLASGRLVLIAKKTSDENGRLGLVVSKKVGKAVTRNRIKRMLRESFRTHKDQFPGVDVVVIARHRAAQSSASQMSYELLSQLSRLRKKID